MGVYIKDDWLKPRSRSTHLTAAEIALLRAAYDNRRRPSDIARELKCSSRIVYKYYTIFRGKLVSFKPKRAAPVAVVRNPEPVFQASASRFYKSNFEI